MTAPSRPLLRWLGGKFRLAEWIVGQMPAHDIYLEPFGGAASVLMRKPRAYNEIINDLDDELVNLFRVLREREAAAELIRRLELTAYAEAEYQLASMGPIRSNAPAGWWCGRTWPTGRTGRAPIGRRDSAPMAAQGQPTWRASGRGCRRRCGRWSIACAASPSGPSRPSC
jgi:hypothetical protein